MASPVNTVSPVSLPPHFRSRDISETKSSTAMIEKTTLERTSSHKRKQEERMSSGEKNHENSEMFKRRMTSHDEDGDERRDTSSSSSSKTDIATETRDQHPEVKRIGSSEMTSALALASLAYTNQLKPYYANPQATRIMRPKEISDMAMSQAMYMRNLSASSSYGSFGMAMNNLYLQDRKSRHPPISLQRGGFYFNRQQIPPMQEKQKKWVCDYCHDKSFDTYHEASLHEEKCQCNPNVKSVSNKQTDREGPEKISLIYYFEGVVPLGVATDSQWLSETNCFVRKYCVEAFSASEDDVLISSKRGRITFSQVGIRCKFCANKDPEDKASGAVSFPVSIHGIYESVKRWKSVHFFECKFIPVEVKEKMNILENTACVPTTRQYWVDSAKALGIDDTADGLRFVSDPLEVNKNETPSTMVKTRFARFGCSLNEKDLYVVYPEDEATVTPFVYFLMRQVQRCYFTEADRFLARSKCDIGSPGFECRHCNGHAGLGRYFPCNPKALSTNSTCQNIYSHVQKCRKCPHDVKDKLKSLKTDKQPWLRRTCGWRQTFFAKVWERLHA